MILMTKLLRLTQMTKPAPLRKNFSPGVITGTDSPSRESRAADPVDSFENWCAQRERREDDRPAARYVSTELPGYEQLDDYGAWRDVPGYGWVWQPRVEAAWAPYHYGHWRWIEPWGWTWVDDAP